MTKGQEVCTCEPHQGCQLIHTDKMQKGKIMKPELPYVLTMKRSKTFLCWVWDAITLSQHQP